MDDDAEPTMRWGSSGTSLRSGERVAIHEAAPYEGHAGDSFEALLAASHGLFDSSALEGFS